MRESDGRRLVEDRASTSYSGNRGRDEAMDRCSPSHLTTELWVSMPQGVVGYQTWDEPDDKGHCADDDGDVVHVAQAQV